LIILTIHGEEYKSAAPPYTVFSTLPSLHPSAVQIFSSASRSETPSVYVPLLMSETMFHTHKTAGKITVLYILTFTFFDSRREDRRFWTEW
jgi:hypothetical protein